MVGSENETMFRQKEFQSSCIVRLQVGATKTSCRTIHHALSCKVTTKGRRINVQLDFQGNNSRNIYKNQSPKAELTLK